MKKELLLAGIILSLAASAAFADPFDPDWRYYTGMSENVSFVLLVAEALVIAGLLTRHKFHFSRVFLAWLAVTFVTYWYMNGGLTLASLVIDTEGRTLRLWLTVLLFEILVVLVEAWVILRMSESRFFREAQSAFPYQAALFVSIAGNAVSFGLGLVNSWLL